MHLGGTWKRITLQHINASPTNPTGSSPPLLPRRYAPILHLGGWFLSPLLTRPSAHRAWRFPEGPALGRGLQLLRHRAARREPALVCRPGLVPGLWCEGSHEAPASDPGLGRDPGRHEARGLGAAPRDGQGETATRRRGTRTTATPGPSGCGDERGGGGRWRINWGGWRQDGGGDGWALPARAGHRHLGGYERAWARNAPWSRVTAALWSSFSLGPQLPPSWVF